MTQPPRTHHLTAAALAMLAAFATLGALAAPASAGVDVGVIVTSTGAGDGQLQPQLTAQIEDWLSRHGHTLVPTPLPSDVIPTLRDCFVQPDPKGCARRIIEAHARSSTMVYALLESSNADNGRDVTLTAYWFDKGHEALAERDTCESCTDQRLRTIADNVMKRLVGVAAAGHVKLKSAPTGAKISIDGKLIGLTPLDWDLTPGPHTIKLEKDGFDPYTRDLVIVSDRTDIVGVKLVPRQDEPAGSSHLLPISMMAAGGAAIATGIVLLAINQPFGPDEPIYVHRTAPAGYAFTAGGLVVGGIGAYLLWFRSPKATSTPVAAFTGDTAYVGWQGRF